MSISDITMKSIIAGVSTAVLDRFFIGETNSVNNIVFGLSTAASIYGVDVISSNIPDNFKSQYINGKKVESGRCGNS